ncbi:hypothetical protein [Bradyrhizobium sp. Gha]|nr:hypothetical protein [Bradyrhizobium sp. Gha]
MFQDVYRYFFQPLDSLEIQTHHFDGVSARIVRALEIGGLIHGF